MMTNMVFIDNISDYQIFQQTDGSADITVTGHVSLQEDIDKSDSSVRLAIIREYNGTYLRFWTKAGMDGLSFRHTFKNVPAGGLYTILSTFVKDNACAECGIRGGSVFHIGVGDLYVIAGQSNSAGYARTPATDPPELGVHIFRNSCTWDVAFHPMNDSTGSVHPENAEYGNSGQSPYLSFCKALKHELNYPIGLIQTSLGGSPLDSWRKQTGGILYRNMIDVIGKCGGRVRGILWYQGCADTCDDRTTGSYPERFAEFVNDVRKDLGDSNLPFITVQLNKYTANISDPGSDRRWAAIREFQRLAPHVLSNVYVVPTLDLSLSDAIHNNSASNTVLGERMAYAALDKIYHREYASAAPDVRRLTLSGDNYAVIELDNVTMYMISFELAPSRLDFVFEDDCGIIPFESYFFDINKLYFKLSKKPSGHLYASYAPYVFTGSRACQDVCVNIH